MSAFSERVVQDIRKIEELSKSINGRVRIKSKSGNPVNRIVLDIEYPTAASSKFPQHVQPTTEVRIALLSRYPFQEPKATITTPIYHPNVYDSGQICFGNKWLPTEGLDLLVKRIIQIITFDDTILNEKSPANPAALNWYRKVAQNNPNVFPTDKLSISKAKESKISWHDVRAEENQRAVISCPECTSSLRVPKGKKGNIACPKCAHKFYIET